MIIYVEILAVQCFILPQFYEKYNVLAKSRVICICASSTQNRYLNSNRVALAHNITMTTHQKQLSEQIMFPSLSMR